MLTSSEIRQLSDFDLVAELGKSRNSLFRQKMGVKTGHLKDSHLIKNLKIYIARLLTEINHRKQFGEKVEKSDPAVSKKAADERSALEKSQEGKEKKRKVKAEKDDKKKVEEVKEEVAGDVKVKKVEKKGLLKKVFSSNKKEEEKK